MIGAFRLLPGRDEVRCKALGDPRASENAANGATIREWQAASVSWRVENGGMAYLFRLDLDLGFIFMGLAGT